VCFSYKHKELLKNKKELFFAKGETEQFLWNMEYYIFPSNVTDVTFVFQNGDSCFNRRKSDITLPANRLAYKN
jgi:hypothetical protein